MVTGGSGWFCEYVLPETGLRHRRPVLTNSGHRLFLVATRSMYSPGEGWQNVTAADLPSETVWITQYS